jgi:hypothetical protein
VSAQTYTKDNTNKQFNGNIKLPATKTKVGTTTLTEDELKGMKKTATDTAQLSELVVLKTQLYIDGTGLHYTYGDSTYTVSLSARTLTGETPPPSGGNLVINGTFTTNTDWTLGADYTITGGKLFKTSWGSSYTTPTINPLSPLTSYTVSFDLSGVTRGGVSIDIGNVAGTIRTADGHYSEILVSDSVPVLTINANGSFEGYIDNVEVIITP